MYFKGTQVHLRALEKADLPLRLKWFNDLEIIRTLLMDIPISMAGTEAWFAKSVEDRSKLNLSIVCNETDKVIGMTGLLQINHFHKSAQFYITIGNKEYWGRKIPDEVIPMVLNYAFVELNLNKVFLLTTPNNERARKVYERNGFQEEARMREHMYVRGQFQDIIQHSVLKTEWVNNPKYNNIYTQTK